VIRHCEGEIDRVLCINMSIFERNTAETLEVINQLREKNIGVLFEKGNIDTLAQGNDFKISTLANLAQDEIRSDSEVNHLTIQILIHQIALSFRQKNIMQLVCKSR